MRHTSLSVIAAALCFVAVARAEPLTDASTRPSDWPQYRGPERSGVSRDTDWIKAWSGKEPQVLWRFNCGTGASSVVISGGRAYTSGNKEDKDTIYCLDAAVGKLIWKYTYDCPLAPRDFEGGPVGSPTLDPSAGRLYAVSHQGQVMCLSLADGSLVWQKNLVTDFDGRRKKWGYTFSPTIDGDRMILDAGGAAGTSTVVVNKNTGELLWKAGNDLTGYASPLVTTMNGRRVVLMLKSEKDGVPGGWLVALDLADGSQLLYQHWTTQIGDPVLVDGDIFISSYYSDKVATRLHVDRDWKVNPVWTKKTLVTHASTAVLWDGHLYGFDGWLSTPQAALKCIDATSGEEKWSLPAGSLGTGGLIIAGGRLIVMSEKGELLIADASPTGFKPDVQLQVFGSKAWTAPSIAEGRIYCRNIKGEVACVGVK